MNAPARPEEITPRTISFLLDGQPVTAFDGETIFKAAERNGVDIPHLCYKDGLRPDGNCRACVVEIKGERTLAPSCCRNVTAGMEVQATSARATKSQKMVLEMLLADLPEQGHKWLDDRAEAPHGELSQWAEHHGVQVRPALAAIKRDALPADLSLIWWLDHAGFDYDVLTDHDLHAEGAAALAPYKVVRIDLDKDLTGWRPD